MENKKNHTQITAVSAYSGPLPPPEALIKYNEASPGAADPIISMAEPQDQVSEPVGLYYGMSTELRESGIVHELQSLGKEDTIWLIRFMERHLFELSDESLMKQEMNPLDALEQLGELVWATGKTPEQLVEEHLKEKYTI